jgi:hypothetical protein
MNKPSDYTSDMFKKLREDISWIKHKLFTETSPKPESITAPEQYSINAVQTDNNSKHEGNNPKTIIRATLNMPKAIRVEAETNEREKNWYHDRTFLIEIFGIAAAIGYAAIAYNQWQDANHNFRTDERPWVTIETALADKATKTPDGMMDVTYSEGSPVLIPVYLKNSGKTPATDIQADILVQIADPKGDTLVLPVGKYVAGKTVPAPVGIMDMLFGILFPDGESGHHIGASRYGTKNGQNGMIPLTHDEVLALSGGTARVFLVGRVDYRDRFGKEHWTTLCKEVWAVSESLNCQLYNAADAND